MNYRLSALFDRCIAAVIAALCTLPAAAQQGYEIPVHFIRDQNAFIRASAGAEIIAAAFNPLPISTYGRDASQFRNYLPVSQYDSNVFARRKFSEYSWLRRKLLYENFIIIDTGLLRMTIDPLFNFSGGQSRFQLRDSGNAETKNMGVWNNTRGFLIRADLGSRFSLETYFYENQSVFPQYIENSILQSGVVPGQGRPKEFKEDAFDYAYSGGYISYQAGRNLGFRFGHHHHFIGDGYKSLFLSDNSFNYPFLRIDARFLKEKLSYSVMYMSLQDLFRIQITGPSEEIFRRKAATYHVVEYSFSPGIRLSLIQGMIWQTMDSTGKSDFDYNMFNPLILFNAARYGMDDVNNPVVGLGLNIRPVKRAEIYGQFAIDDGDLNQRAWQAGLKCQPLENLLIQVEGNMADRDMYSSTSGIANSAFTHYNQPLAHNLGSDFEEIIFRANWRYKRILCEIQVNMVSQSQQNSSYLTSGALVTTYGADQRRTWAKAEAGYLLNPAANMKVFLSYTQRLNEVEAQGVKEGEAILYFGIKTDLRNIYWDF